MWPIVDGATLILQVKWYPGFLPCKGAFPALSLANNLRDCRTILFPYFFHAKVLATSYGPFLNDLLHW